MCYKCNSNIKNINPQDNNKISRLTKRIQKNVKDGKYKNSLIDTELTLQTAQNFVNQAFTAYGYNFNNVAWMDNHFQALSVLEQNLYSFAAYKNANYIQELKEIQHLNKEEYIKAAKKITKNYYQNYLNTEINFAQRVAAQHRRWNDILLMQNEFNIIQFKTREDNRVRDKHKKYNNFAAPVSNPIWKHIYPPIKGDYGCRCFALQHFEMPPDAVTANPKKIPSSISPAVTGIPFDNSHPYFKNAQKASNLINNITHNILAKQVKQQVLKTIIPNKIAIIKNKHIPDYVQCTNNDLRVAAGKPHNQLNQKNRILLNINDVFKNAQFIYSTPDNGKHNIFTEWLYFKTNHNGFFINIAKTKNNKYKFYAITDSIKK